jgi:hypothetical protein
MFKRPLLLAGGFLCAVIVAACANGGPTASLPPPSNQNPSPTVGITSLNGASVTATLPPTSGITGSIVFPAGNGTIAQSTSVTAPSAVTPLSGARSGPTIASVSRSAATGSRSVAATLAPSNATPILYITLSSAGGASLTAAPAFSLTLPTALTGVVPYLASWSGTAWDAVSTATGSPIAGTLNGTAVTVPGGGGGIALLAGQSTYYSVYTIPAPSPTPMPSTAPTNLIKDPNFAAGLSASQVYTWGPTTYTSPPPITNTGWSQCSVRNVPASVYISPNIAASPAAIVSPPASKYTPIAATTPAAVPMAAGAAAPGGSYSPAPTQTSVPVYGSATTAAVFGGVDSSSPAPYAIGDWAYNGLCQQVAVPSNGATVTAEVWESGNDYPGTHLDMVDLVGVVDGSQNLIGYLYAENKETAASPGDTAYRQIIVDIPQTVFGGQTINLFLGQYAYGGSGSKYYDYWFVDDVNVTAGEPTNASTSILRNPGAAIRR